MQIPEDLKMLYVIAVACCDYIFLACAYFVLVGMLKHPSWRGLKLGGPLVFACLLLTAFATWSAIAWATASV